MAGPTAEEQYQLELINAFRLNPLADTSRYITSYSPLVSPYGDIQAALNYFGVSGTLLQSQLAALTPVQPVAWNDQLAAAAAGHDQQMIAADQQSHQLPGEADLGGRATAAGYTNWSYLEENVYAYSDNPLYAQAGFVVDWGPGTGGMQTPPGHRENMISPDVREVGIAIVPDTNPADQVGPEVETEDFGAKFNNDSFVLGVAYNDLNGDDFYEPGEAVAGLNVSLGPATVSNWASGGYTLETGATGLQTVSFTGGGLAGTETALIHLTAQSDVKFDVVNGNEIKTSASAVFTGPVGKIEGLGETGLTIGVTGAGAHVVDGTVGNDSLAASSGSDTILGLDGNDTIAGGAGADLINGNKGDDLIQGGSGASTLYGGQGNDTIYGGPGHDLINGNIGNDIIHAGNGGELIYGGQGDDTIYGGSGPDTISGDLGDDLMYGGAGADRFLFRPGSGQDRVGDFNYAEGDRVQLPVGTAYTASLVGGSEVIDLGHGDTLTLMGVTTLPADAIVFA